MQNESKKKNLLIISSNPERQSILSDFISNHNKHPIILNAPDARIGLSKIQNSQIDIIIADSESNKVDILKVVETIIQENVNPNCAIIIIGHPPAEVQFLDEIVSGKLYFIDDKIIETEFAYCLEKALSFNTHSEPTAYFLRTLFPGDILIKEGDIAEHVYILKHGELRAFNMINGQKVIIGNIGVGEFVGEMSYINKEPRSAFIEAVIESELIEVPIGLFDKILFKRPAWAKALMNTLSKRLRSANKLITKS
jgi:CheY-like chemotaxis protein